VYVRPFPDIGDKMNFIVEINAQGTGLDTTHKMTREDILDILHNLHKDEIVDFYDNIDIADITVKTA